MQTLSKFLEQHQEEVERFQAHWEKKHEEEPKHYPLSMKEAEWHEQLLMFLSDPDRFDGGGKKKSKR